MSRPLSMDDSKFPRIRRFEIHRDPVCALDLSADQSRFMSDTELRRLRDALNADAADTTCTPTEHMSGRASVIEHVRCAADNFNESYWPDFEHMTAAEQNVVWAEVHDAISTCLIALGHEMAARVTTDELALLASQLRTAHAHTEHDVAREKMMYVMTDLIEMSKRTSDDGTAMLWQVDHVDGDCPWIVEHDSLDEPEFIGPQPADVTDEQLVEVVRNMLDADPCTFVIRRREKTEPLRLEIATLPRFGKNAALAQIVIDTAKTRGVAIEMTQPKPEPPQWTAEPHESGHQWWYRAWTRQRRLLTFDADIEAWFLLDDGHVNQTPSLLQGYTHSDVCAFAGEGDMFAPATIPEPPS